MVVYLGEYDRKDIYEKSKQVFAVTKILLVSTFYIILRLLKLPMEIDTLDRHDFVYNGHWIVENFEVRASEIN